MKPETVGVVGLGRLGVCIALALERCGHSIVGLERDSDRADAIRRRALQTDEPDVAAHLTSAERLTIAADLDALVRAGCGVVLVAVATPSLPSGGYDHSQIDGLVEALVAFGRPSEPSDLVIVSTVMPGYCDQVATRLAESGWRVSYNPAFIALGSILANLARPDVFLVGAHNVSAAERITAIWQPVWTHRPAIKHVSRTEAELAKIATNSFLTLKIAFANAVGDFALRFGGDPAAVLGAIGADSRIGVKSLGYGYGYGGPCLPRDNRALDRAARDSGADFALGRGADVANQMHLDFQVEQALQRDSVEPIVFGRITYKPDTSSLEESQPLALALRLARQGRRVTVRERANVIDVLRATYGNLFEYEPENK